MREVKEHKIKAVAELEDKFRRAKALTVTDYRGLTVEKMNALRRELRQAGTEYKVLKNTLSTIAFQRVGGDEKFLGILTGPVAIAFDYEDITAGIKILSKFAKQESQVFQITGGYVEGHFFSARDMDTLATMPGKDELRSMLLSVLQAPLRNFVSVVGAPVRNVVGVLKNYADKLA